MNKQRIIIGISGPSASGKSLLATTIVDELGSKEVKVLPEDSYYKDRSDITLEERAKINYDHPDAFDHELLISHLQDFMQGKSIQVPKYDFANHCRASETIEVSGHSILVIEGIMLFAEPALRELMDIKIFMDTSLDTCFIRRLRRDMTSRGRTLDSILDQYETTVKPMYIQFIEPAKRYADVIVPRGGENRIAIDMIKAKMKELLANIKQTIIEE